MIVFFAGDFGLNSTQFVFEGLSTSISYVFGRVESSYWSSDGCTGGLAVLAVYSDE